MAADQETKKKTGKKFILAAAVLAVLALLLLILLGMCRIREVTVTGNDYYTKEEIADLIIQGAHQRNTIYLYLRYKYGKHQTIPFIDDFEVSIQSYDSITIRVYEKNIVGYVRYLGKNVYFDKDGIVVESSGEEMEGVPLISGLHFDRFAMYESLNVENTKVFDTILEITQLLEKYDLILDEIRFGSTGELNLQLGEVRVMLGGGEHLEEKIARLKQLEPDLLDKSGTLHMENYTDESMHISLEAIK